MFFFVFFLVMQHLFDIAVNGNVQYFYKGDRV